MINQIKKSLGLVLIGSFFVLSIFSITLMFNSDIWYDEIYSMNFAFRSIKNMISYTSQDVHPPLYYIILRFFVFWGTIMGFTPAEFLGKFASFVPFLLVSVYGWIYLKKRFGLFTTGLFIFMNFSMPAIVEYIFEIRMYSWGMFFVTATLIHALLLIEKSNENHAEFSTVSYLHLLMIFIYSTAAFYTHYFAAIAICSVLFLVFIATIIKTIKKDTSSNYTKKLLFAFPLIAILIIIAYIPWISTVLSQVEAVSNNYWIPPITIKTPFTIAKFLFFSSIGPKTITYICGFMTLGLFFVSFIKMVQKHESYSEPIIISLLVLPIVLLVSIIASVVIRPILVPRYLIQSHGTFILGFSIMLGQFVNKSKHIQKAIVIAVTLIILFVGTVNFSLRYQRESFMGDQTKKTLEVCDTFDDDTIIITNSSMIHAPLVYYLNTNRQIFDDSSEIIIKNYQIYGYNCSWDGLFEKILPGMEYINSFEELESFRSQGKKIIVFGNDDFNNEIKNKWINHGFMLEKFGHYNFERYYFDAYYLY